MLKLKTTTKKIKVSSISSFSLTKLNFQRRSQKEGFYNLFFCHLRKKATWKVVIVFSAFLTFQHLNSLTLMRNEREKTFCQFSKISHLILHNNFEKLMERYWRISINRNNQSVGIRVRQRQKERERGEREWERESERGRELERKKEREREW